MIFIILIQSLVLFVFFINDCSGFIKGKTCCGSQFFQLGSRTVEPSRQLFQLGSPRTVEPSRMKPLNLWGKKKSPPPEPVSEPVPEKKKGISGLLQLIAFGAGAPLLGEFEKFDEKGTALFKLEANNLVDSKGEIIQTRAKFFNEGWTEASEQAIKPPGFLENLLSGGRLMEEWDSKNRVTK